MHFAEVTGADLIRENFTRAELDFVPEVLECTVIHSEVSTGISLQNILWYILIPLAALLRNLTRRLGEIPHQSLRRHALTVVEEEQQRLLNAG